MTCHACKTREAAYDRTKCRRCLAYAADYAAHWRIRHGKVGRQERTVKGWNFTTDDLIVEHVPKAKAIARSIKASTQASIDVDDMIGDALYGLVVAGRTYDTSYNRPFAQWANTQIYGAVYDGIRRWRRRQGREQAAGDAGADGAALR